MTTPPKPLAKVEQRSDVKRYRFTSLGPPPETWDTHYRNPDGSSMPQHAEKMAEMAWLTGKKPDPKKEPLKRKAAAKK